LGKTALALESLFVARFVRTPEDGTATGDILQERCNGLCHRIDGVGPHGIPAVNDQMDHKHRSLRTFQGPDLKVPGPPPAFSRSGSLQFARERTSSLRSKTLSVATEGSDMPMSCT